ncbi:MAG TPA: hypothetical protein VG929_05885 [Actinomycetota bacterium]|nr:hypothetical protein [Actinomycetota bacterium]
MDASRSVVDAQKVGLATLVAGICFIVASLGSALVDAVWVAMILGFGLLVYAVPRLHRYQAPADGAIGLWGSRLVAAGGLIVLALGIVYLVWEAVGTPPEEDPGIIGPLWMIGFFGFAIGIILFTIASLKAKVLPQGAAILMLVGLVGSLAIDMATGAFFEDEGRSTTQWGFYIGVPLFGLGLAWIGYWLWKSRAAATSGEAAAPAV